MPILFIGTLRSSLRGRCKKRGWELMVKITQSSFPFSSFPSLRRLPQAINIRWQQRQRKWIRVISILIAIISVDYLRIISKFRKGKTILSINVRWGIFTSSSCKKKMESSCFASGVLDVLGLRSRIMAYFAVVGENEAWVDFFWFSPSSLFSSWCSYVKKRKEVCIKTRSSSARILTIVYWS